MADLRTYNLNLNEKTLQETYQVMVDNSDKDVLFDFCLKCGEVKAYILEEIDPNTFYIEDSHVAIGYIQKCPHCNGAAEHHHEVITLQRLVDDLYIRSRFEVEQKLCSLQEEARYYKKYLKSLVKADGFGLYSDFISRHKEQPA